MSFDITQVRIRNHEEISQNITIVIKYVVDFLEYQNKIRSLSENIALTVSKFVLNNKNSLQRANIVPLLFLIFLGNISFAFSNHLFFKIYFSQFYSDMHFLDNEHHYLDVAVLPDVQL